MLKIVVVDDEFLVIEGIKLLVLEMNIECEIVGYASDGCIAFEMIQEHEPNVLITDIKMPGMNGLELIRKGKELYPNMLTIVISGYQDFTYAQKAIGLGVINYIYKPITLEKLETSLRMAEDVYYKSVLKSNSNPYLFYKSDALIKAQNQKNYEEMERIYQNIKVQMHQEPLSLEDYKKYMYMLVTFVAGVYYDNEKRNITEKHFPSYRNLYLLQTCEEVDQYVDFIILDIISKMKMENKGVVHRTIKDLIRHLEEHYDAEISLQEMADMAGMNPVYLSTLFKEETGISYSKYLKDIRIAKAKKFLMEGYLVTEVSEKIGYHNYRYFCDLFKKNVGMTPNEYKGTVRKDRE